MSRLRRALLDLIACLRFYSRLPVPTFAFEADPHAMPDFSRIIVMLPLAALVIALPGVLVLWFAAAAGLPASVTAGLVLATLVMTTGAFHEDGLADMADGFGGGATRERKLEIMRDSRIGSYGAVAMILAQGLRWACLAALISASPERAGLAVFAAAAVSRVAGLVPLALLPPARKDGAAYAAQRPAAGSFWRALALALICGLLPALAGAGVDRLMLGSVAVLAAGFALAGISRRQIGGQTGDVAGAAQQVGEIAYLLVLVAS